jgi:hypothetical protein
MRFILRKALLLTAGERARRVHEVWLNRAVSRDTAMLRIPVRRVDEGGFSHLRGDPGGQQWAEQWWMDAVARADMVMDA